MKDERETTYLPFGYCSSLEANREIREGASSSFVFNKISQQARSILNILTFSISQPVAKEPYEMERYECCLGYQMLIYLETFAFDRRKSKERITEPRKEDGLR